MVAGTLRHERDRTRPGDGLRRALAPRARAAIAFALGALLSAAAGGAAAAPEVRETHRDWTVVCDAAGDGAERCSIVQALSHRETEQMILRVEVGYLPDTRNLVAVVTVPLGVHLPPGLELRIDEGETTRHEFGSCLERGCIAGIDLSDAQLAALKAGARAHFTFRDARRQPVTVPISLAGFTAAVSTLENAE